MDFKAKPPSTRHSFASNVFKRTKRCLQITWFYLVVLSILFLIQQQQQKQHHQKPTEKQNLQHLNEEPQVSTYKHALQSGKHYLTRPLREAVPCLEKDAYPRTEQRGSYWVLYNYVSARRSFHCWESITFCTHGHYDQLDDLQPLLERWRGPVSMAVHAPGTDFNSTLTSIRWARSCSYLVADLVTFHIFFESRHLPYELPRPERALDGPAPNCTEPAPWTNIFHWNVYRTLNNLMYRKNVARNIARESATTYFLLSSDLGLYPSNGIIDAFLKMVQRDDTRQRRSAAKVFALPVFEVKKGLHIPRNKKELVTKLKLGTVVPFECSVFPECNTLPHFDAWRAAKISKALHTFHVQKSVGDIYRWEQMFISTDREPLYDERLSIPGMDSMEQAYILCVLGYEFHILDNAFLCHKPGNTIEIPEGYSHGASDKGNEHISKTRYFSDLKILYGVRNECEIWEELLCKKN